MIVTVGLGSNLGPRHLHLASGIARLRAIATVTAISRVYETAPVGGPTQGAFLNAAANLDWTSADLHALLRATQAIEAAEGRRGDVRWGPRTLDIDLLFAEGVTIDSETLTLPHPRLFERAFALVPVLDIARGPLAELAALALSGVGDSHVVKLTDYTLS
jgi:2-amino-4-hydroxy-6-hydroxymethyldihydropteridine diphosphokinase